MTRLKHKAINIGELRMKTEKSMENVNKQMNKFKNKCNSYSV